MQLKSNVLVDQQCKTTIQFVGFQGKSLYMSLFQASIMRVN